MIINTYHYPFYLQLFSFPYKNCSLSVLFHNIRIVVWQCSSTIYFRISLMTFSICHFHVGAVIVAKPLLTETPTTVPFMQSPIVVLIRQYFRFQFHVRAHSMLIRVHYIKHALILLSLPEKQSRISHPLAQLHK